MTDSDRHHAQRDLRILVIGGTGFLGRILAGHLTVKGFTNVRYVVHRTKPDWLDAMPVETILCPDLTGPELSPVLADTDVVINLLRPDGTGWCLEATTRIVSMAAERGVSRVIHLSSIDVYGDIPDRFIDEQTPPQPATPYASEHLALERVVLSKIAEPHVLRLGAVFGPGGRNVISFAAEARDAAWLRLAARRALYGRRRMHLVSAETVCAAVSVLASTVKSADTAPIMLVTDDGDERNDFAFLQDQLLTSVGRRPMHGVPALPKLLLKSLLRLRGQPANLPRRRFSDERLKRLTEIPDFAMMLKAYADTISHQS